jgi:ABC-2 type transport system ATP-binding protein
MSDIVLSINDLSKKYKKQLALDSISLQINKGDIYGLIGENGAGKTTFLRSIAGLIRTEVGEISLFNNSNFRKELHRVGFVIESPFLYLSNTAKENLAIYCKLQNVELSRIPEVLKLVGLSKCYSVNHGDFKKKVGKFSLGMKQRLSIALALITIPEFLVLDEPYNGLDYTGIQELNELMKLLNRTGVTLLVSNHILSELETYATKYGFIHEGQLVLECEKSELKKPLKETYKELMAVL